jgi:hypothetical protein
MGNFEVETRTIDGHVDIWTQRKDKNGNKIYTNDILLVSPDEQEVVVGYEPLCDTFCGYKDGYSAPYMTFQQYKDSDLEVIGNIYEGTPSRCPYGEGDYVIYNEHLFKVVEVYGDHVDLEGARGNGYARGIHYRSLTATSKVPVIPLIYLPYLVGRKYKLVDGEVGIITAVYGDLVLVGNEYVLASELPGIIANIEGKPFLPIVCNDDKGSPCYHKHSVLWLSPEDNINIAMANGDCNFLHSIT